MIQFPTLADRPVDALVEAQLDEIAREGVVAPHLVKWNPEIPRLSLDRAGECVEHADAEGREIVDEELIDVLGRNDKRHVGRGVDERAGKTAVAGIEGGHLRRVAQCAGVDDVCKMRCGNPKAKLRHDPSPLLRCRDRRRKRLRRQTMHYVITVDEIGQGAEFEKAAPVRAEQRVALFRTELIVREKRRLIRDEGAGVRPPTQVEYHPVDGIAWRGRRKAAHISRPLPK